MLFKQTDIYKPMFKREIKSFVRRQRRLTAHQEKALEIAWPLFGIDVVADKKLEIQEFRTTCERLPVIDAAREVNSRSHLKGRIAILPFKKTPSRKESFAKCETPEIKKEFGRDAEKILEIGFGLGDTILSMAKKNPDKDYLGIEVHEPGVAAVMLGIIENKLTNIRVIQADAVKILRDIIPDSLFSRIHIYFPDPWPKKKHHKRRIIQADFVTLLCAKLNRGGVIHCATDWQSYAEQMMRVFSENTALKNCIGENQFADNEKLQLRVNTKFEKRGTKLGHGVWDLLFEKIL